MDEKYVFISYAHKDSERVLSVINAMRQDGISVWYDEGIEAGTEWPEYIAEKINDCAVFIAFITANAVASVNCRNEINYAISLHKEMLVVYLEDTELSAGMQLQLGSIQAMFCHRSRSEEEFLRNLLTARILQPLKKAVAEPPSQSPAIAPVSSETKPEAPAPEITQTLPVKPTEEGEADIAPQKAENGDEAPRRGIIRGAKLLTPLFALLSVVIGALGISLVTEYIANGWLIFLFGVLTPVLTVALPVLIYRAKMKSYTYRERCEVEEIIFTYLFLAFLASVIADCFYVNCADRVIFKILISIGVNLLGYFIALLTVPTASIDKNK